MELEKADFCMDQQIKVMIINMDTVSLPLPGPLFHVFYP